MLRAVSLLKEVTQLLVAETDCSSTKSSNTHLPTTTHQPQAMPAAAGTAVSSSHARRPTASGVSTCNASTRGTASSVSPTSRQLNILQSFSGLFSPYNGPSSRLPSNPGPSGNSGQSRSVFQPRPSKRGRFVPKETWTHDFFCLQSPTATIVPQRSIRTYL